jgi:hypothetical protein
VEVSMRLDAFGGFEGAEAGALDSRASLFRLKLPVEKLMQRGHAVIHLDLERSLLGKGENRLLLPTYQIKY